MLGWLAQSCGWQPTVLSCPLSLLNHVENHHVDIILTDLNMPKLNGIQLVTILRRMGWPGGVLFMTGNPAAITEQDRDGLQILQVLSKPLGVQDIEEALLATFSQVSENAHFRVVEGGSRLLQTIH